MSVARQSLPRPSPRPGDQARVDGSAVRRSCLHVYVHGPAVSYGAPIAKQLRHDASEEDEAGCAAVVAHDADKDLLGRPPGQP